LFSDRSDVFDELPETFFIGHPTSADASQRPGMVRSRVADHRLEFDRSLALNEQLRTLLARALDAVTSSQQTIDRSKEALQRSKQLAEEHRAHKRKP
jgi:hypothetical protein